MTDKALVALALAVGLSGGVMTAAAQDRGGNGAAARPCPALTARADARGMTAQATAPAGTATSSRSWWMMGGAGRNPVGAPGMYTGIDTGVTRTRPERERDDGHLRRRLTGVERGVEPGRRRTRDGLGHRADRHRQRGSVLTARSGRQVRGST
jgi:hypothetical protein